MAGAMDNIGLPTPELLEKGPGEQELSSLLSMDKGGSQHAIGSPIQPKRERRRSISNPQETSVLDSPSGEIPIATLQATVESLNSDWKALNTDFEDMEISIARTVSAERKQGTFGRAGSSGASSLPVVLSPRMRSISGEEVGELYDIGENAPDLPAFHDDLPPQALEHEMVAMAHGGVRRTSSNERRRRSSLSSSVPISDISEDKEYVTEELPLDTANLAAATALNPEPPR